MSRQSFWSALALLAVLTACNESNPDLPTVQTAALEGDANDPFLATAPAVAPQRSLAANGSHHYRITVPAAAQGLRIPVACSANCTVYLRRTSATGSVQTQSGPGTLHTLFRTTAQATADDLWFLEVRAGSQPVTYDLRIDDRFARPITWDNGAAATSTSALAQPDTLGGDYLYTLSTQLSAWGAWRTVLVVDSGEAALYVQQTPDIPSTGTQFRSEKSGSDATVIASNQFAAAQTWTIRVIAQPGATWRLFTGDLYVTNLGALASDGASSGNLTIGPEGTAWARTQVPAGALAWRLMSPSGTTLYVNDNTAPVPGVTSTYDLTRAAQLLVVPDTLTSGQFIVAVQGPAGTVALDSRQQQVRNPTTQPGFSGNGFAFTLDGTDDNGFGYVTYRVDVPVQQIAWEVTTDPSQGDVDVYVRRGKVPAEYDNSGMSEIAGTVDDSLVQVPPTLTDGPWYITVRGTPPFAFQLKSGIPEITPIAYVSSTPNGAANATRAGWRYFRVTDIESQEGTLGWILDLANQAPNTQIAVRRNGVPGRWYYRENRQTSVSEGSHLDASSDTGFLERPNHPPDIWYVGIFQRTEALGNFTLTTSQLAPTTLDFNAGDLAITTQPSGRFRWFKVTAPASALGWDLRLTNITAGKPKLVVRQDLVPATFNDIPSNSSSVAQWVSGNQWAPSVDYTNRAYGPYVNGQPNDDQQGRRLVMAMGAPLSASVYYVGVGDMWTTPAGTPLTYHIESRGIGEGNAPGGQPWGIQVQTLAFNGGSVSASNVPARDVRYYKVDVPANSESYGAMLDPTTGESQMALQWGRIPHSNPYYYAQADDDDGVGARRQRNGRDWYYRYPANNQSTIRSGPLFIAVSSEGVAPYNNSFIGTGSSSFTLDSIGQVPVAGGVATVLDTEDPLTFAGQSARYGEHKVFRFSVPAEGVSSMEIRLKNATGRPYFTVSKSPNLYPTPQESYYATEGASTSIGGGDPSDTLTITAPSGTYTVLVATQQGSGSTEPDTTFDLEITPRGEELLAFNDGTVSVTAQAPQTWRYFRVDVPAGQMGWDLRLTNVTSGQPRMAIRRDLFPAALSSTCCYVYSSESWTTGHTWAPDLDMSGRSYAPYVNGQTPVSQYGRFVQMGNRPLVPGTYYIGVIDSTSSSAGAPMTYTLESRGIGIGNAPSGDPWSIQISDMTFDDAKTVTLPAREHAYFRVTVPQNATSFEVELEPTSGEAMLALNSDSLPNAAAYYYSAPTGSVQGLERQKNGREYFYWYPDTNQASITPSGAKTMYIAVLAEGQSPYNGGYIGSGSTTFTLRTKGQVESTTAPAPLATGSPVTFLNQTMRYGENRTYHFTVPAGTLGMEVKVTNRTGTANLAMSRANNVQFVGPSQTYYSAYGGWSASSYTSNQLTIAQPAGTWTITASANGSNESDSDFDIEVTALAEEILDFNGGEATATNQPATSWRYFRVTVPDAPGLLGWDLRLLDVTSGLPRIVVKRDSNPDSISTTGSLYNQTTWPTNYQWAPDVDITGRSYPPYVVGQNPINWQGRTLVAGMNAPLQPGNYVVGILGSGSTDPLSYRLVSRGIGIGEDPDGDPWAQQVVDVPWDGERTFTNVPARDVAYVRVVVPDAVEALGFTLETLDGEAMMAVKKEKLPNIAPYVYSDADDQYGVAARRQKSGNEYHYQYVSTNQTTLTPGNWYFALASEGKDPYNAGYVGTGTSTFRFKSLGRLLPEGGIDKLVTTTTGTRFDGQSLRFGEQRIYRFRVAADVPAYEIRLENRVGQPYFSAQMAPFFKTSIPSVAQQDYVAASNGQSYISYDSVADTVVDRTGDVTVVVTANRDQNQDRDAQFDLVITPRKVDPLAWRGGSADISLQLKQTAFYRLEVPNDCDGVPLAGWLVTADDASGTYTIRARKDSLPEAPGGSTTFQAAETQVVVAPPYFGPGIWYVSVEATTPAALTITSEEISELQHWDMPDRDTAPNTPGVPAPNFGDSGTLPDGSPLNGSDRGTDLGHGRHHFYRVTIPPGNRGMLATYLEALSGNPDLYIRKGAAPTRNHGSGGGGGSLYDWYDTLQNTTYGHLVPDSTRNGYELDAGEWWLAVFAPSSNVRYRLKVGLGSIEPLDFDNGLVTGATLSGGDMKHYLVRTPQSSTVNAESMPTTWGLRLLQQQGDAVVFVREWIPSGHNNHNLTPSSMDGSSYWSTWVNDRSNIWGASTLMPSVVVDNSGTSTLALPPLMPDTDYIVSVFAKTQTVFDLESIPGASKLAIDGVVDFYSGTVDTTLAPGQKKVYRIDVPSDAARWMQDVEVGPQVWMFLQLGTLPAANNADRYNSGSNSPSSVDWDFPLYSTSSYQYNWPWMPDRSYYLVVENRNAAQQPFKLTMDGRDTNDDSDVDGLPDWWEYNYFSGLYYNATADYDSDELPNADELELGTDPTQADSDGDGLYDGLEVLIGADPFDPNSDDDLACDGDDSAPGDPNESGEIIRLTMHKYTDGSFGKGHGTNRHTTTLRAVFKKDTNARTHWLHFKGFDIEGASEVGIYINGELVSHLPVGANNQSSTPFLLWVESDTLRSGDNFVELRKTSGGDTEWGVDDLGLFTYGDSFGYDSTGAYDTRHPNGLHIEWLEPEQGLYEMRAFDLENAGELTIDLDGQPWIDFPTSSDLQWTRYFQVPLGAIDLPSTPIPAKTLDVTRHGGDGDWQWRLVERRDGLTQTFGTNYSTGIDGHARDGMAWLFPVKPGNREIKVVYQAWPEGSGMTLGGTNVALYPSAWPQSQNFSTSEILLCSLADDIDTSIFTYVPPEGTTRTFNVRVNYYGVALDSDNDQHDDCIDKFPRNPEEWDDEDGDRLGDNWEREYFGDLDPADGTTNADNDSGSDLDEFLAGTDPVCADNDGDLIDGVNGFCATGLDCNDNDPEVGAASNDADCDLVPSDVDCDDSDPDVVTTRVNDADCDGVPTDIDCNDADPEVVTTNATDADCDGYPTAEDCDDSDAGIGTSLPGDNDCDGVAGTIDCDDDDPEVRTTNIGDADCDGTPTADDCNDNDPDVTTSDTDHDCDGVAMGLDCDDNDPDVTHTNLGDADCDGIPTALDCDDTNGLDGELRDANDADCDDLPTPIDCDDTDRNDKRSRVNDADCDDVPKDVDCNDQDAGVTRTNVGDLDCDEVPSEVDCNDHDALDRRSKVGDQDCDGAPAGVDCDDNDPTVQVCPQCVDIDEDGHDARSESCPDGDDCDDGDNASTWREVDADCDGARVDDDCDDEDPDSGVTADDADCDGVTTAEDCDDDDSLAGPREGDTDCDGIPDTDDNCESEPNPTQDDADGDDIGDACEQCVGDDGDGDFVSDNCDKCPTVPDDQTDSDGDGTGDACEDGDGDGVLDLVDVCPAVPDADQLDSDRDGIGDACDTVTVTKSKEDGSCSAGGGMMVWGVMIVLLMRRRGWMAVAMAVLLVGCGDEPKKARIGSTCDLDGDCESGLCMAGQCFEPEGDEDDDTLVNVREITVGTNAFDGDTDKDLKPDADEVGIATAAKDEDGDGIIDAVESLLGDQDHDCIDDEHDATNTSANTPSAAAITAVCPDLGVCQGGAVSVYCPEKPTEPACDFRAVIGYERAETLCDLRDNDCDGDTDEGCDPLAIALLDHWQLDGDGQDSGPYGDHGTVVGATAAADRFGTANRALHFVADGDHVAVPISHHPLGSADVSYTAWVKPDEGQGELAGIVSFGELAPLRRGALVVDGTKRCASYVGSDNDGASATACAPPSHWSLLAVVKVGRVVKFYLDARLQGEVTLAADQDIRRTLVSIGVSRIFTDGSARDQFRGTIDDVRLYGRALRESDLQTLFEEGEWRPPGSAANPARSCLHVRDAGRPEGDGSYHLDPDGDGVNDDFEAYCDMTTDGGGWTLAWVYQFTDTDDFTAASNAVTPIPSWPAALADVTISEAAPTGPTTSGAIPWDAWSAIGTSFMVSSDLEDTLACDSADGSFATGVEGPVTCRVVADTTSACDGTLPDWVFFWEYGPGLSADNLFYYFDGSTTDNWPTHDPCGTNAPPGTVVAGSGGALYLR